MSEQVDKFIEVGSEYKHMLETVEHGDGDVAWMKLNELREDFFYASMELHKYMVSKKREGRRENK